MVLFKDRTLMAVRGEWDVLTFTGCSPAWCIAFIIYILGQGALSKALPNKISLPPSKACSGACCCVSCLLPNSVMLFFYVIVLYLCELMWWRGVAWRVSRKGEYVFLIFLPVLLYFWRVVVGVSADFPDIYQRGVGYGACGLVWCPSFHAVTALYNGLKR